MLVNGTVLPVVSMTPVVPSACCTTLCTCEEDSAVAVAAAPLIVPAAVMVYVPSGNVAPVLSVGVQPVIGTVPAACGPRSIVFTTWPALFVTLTVMSPSAFAVCAPKALALPMGSCFNEPVHVPSRTPGHQGWLLSVVDHQTGPDSFTHECWIIDAGDPGAGPVARVAMPHRLRPQVHGWWAA